MAMRTVGASAGVAVVGRSSAVSASGRRTPRPPGPQQDHAEGEARHRHRHPGPAEHRAGAVGERRTRPDRPARSTAQGEDRPEHEQAHREQVGPVAGELASGRLPDRGHHPRLGAGAFFFAGAVAARGRLAGRCSWTATTNPAASWSRASPEANTTTTRHTAGIPNHARVSRNEQPGGCRCHPTSLRERAQRADDREEGSAGDRRVGRGLRPP